MGITLTGVWIGMMVGNFIFRWFTDQNWAVAIDNSIAQGVALFVAWVVIKFDAAPRRQ